MKILELRLKNLNSLYDEWIINFTHPEYLSNGIFVLAGPTGAGKSTILDAICLALYGETPRLGRITQSENEIMSRQRGECYAEVLFESQVGQFRCHWEQRRARKAPEGKLQSPEHQITDASTGKLIETQKSLVAGIVEEKTGMDFDRFTRSVLLAQGNFDTFLKADAKDKSEILEQITGTDIYSHISCRVHERQRREQQKMEGLRTEISSIEILKPEEEADVRRELKEKQEENTGIEDESTETGKAIAWLETIEKLKEEKEKIAGDMANLQEDMDAFEPKRARLNLANKAASLSGPHATLTALRRQSFKTRQNRKDLKATLPHLEKSVNTEAEALKKAEEHRLKIKKAVETARPLIQRIRQLDGELKNKQDAVSKEDGYCAGEETEINSIKDAQAREQKKQTNTEKTLGLTENYLKEHAPDEWLVSNLTGVEAQLEHLRLKQTDIDKKETAIEEAQGALEQATEEYQTKITACSRGQQEWKAAEQNLKQGQEKLKELLAGRLLREYRDKKDNLLHKMAFLTRIEELESHRDSLEDGTPCPLCGSTAHPFAEGNVPTPNETEEKVEALGKLITRAEGMEETNKDLKVKEDAAHTACRDSETQRDAALREEKAAERLLAGLKENLESLQDDLNQLKEELRKKLRPLGIAELPEAEFLLESLKKRLKTWEDKINQKNTTEEQLAEIKNEIGTQDAIIQTRSKALTARQKNLKTLREEHDTAKKERRELYDDKNPDTEEHRLEEALAEAEEAEKEARTRHTNQQEELSAAQVRLVSLEEGLDRLKPELQQAKTRFLEALQPSDFASERQFLRAILPAEQQETLAARAEELDNKQTVLETRHTDREDRLREEIAKKITQKTLDELRNQLEEHQNSRQGLIETIAALELRLKQNTAASKRIEEKQGLIEAQERECQRWNKLHGLIGSADGKKYRNFAQGLTFELMVSHANHQLASMTDRYLLFHDSQRPLELKVLDNYQAGEFRPTRNLSGGESFIVSLALALGLSKMASRKVRVDSLFLDEGFGTLDETALETALQTLASLSLQQDDKQQDGKLIGVISHIAALKERIPTQISVAPVAGGRSSLPARVAEDYLRGKMGTLENPIKPGIFGL